MRQVRHIIRTAVRIIDRHRTLVLYIYDRERAAGGDPAPVWTMFQTDKDYITLARNEDGSAYWREAAFERLGGSCRFTDKYAFCSARDEQRVCDFFHDHDHDGTTALIRAQRAILDKRARKRRIRQEKRTIERMGPLRALPRGLPGWTRREVMPAYFRCWHTSVKRPLTGVCTSCGKESTIPGAAHGSKTVCPRCKRELTVKSAGKIGKHSDRDTVQIIEKVSRTEVVVRIMKVWYGYDRNGLTPEMDIRENARVFVRRGPDGETITEPYYYSCDKGTLTHWVPGKRPRSFSHYQYNFEADDCGHVYCRGLPEALAETPWQYCPVATYYGHFREPMQMVPFLQAHLEHPKLEHLVKVGFFSLASELVYGWPSRNMLDESQDRTHRILRVAAEDVAFLRELDADPTVLEIFRGYGGTKDRQRLLLWQLERHVSYDIDRVLERVTAHKLMKYMDSQCPDGGGSRYTNMQHAVSDYRDYLDACAKLGYDMKSSFVLCPRDLRAAHDEAIGRVKAENDAKLYRDFEAAMAAIPVRLDFEADGMRILLPASADDIVAEGQALHHCVGGYIDRAARHECVILFIRRCEEPDKPFYTVEVRGREVIQVRGWDNGDPTTEVEKFMAQWKEKVLLAA